MFAFISKIKCLYGFMFLKSHQHGRKSNVWSHVEELILGPKLIRTCLDTCYFYLPPGLERIQGQWLVALLLTNHVKYFLLCSFAKAPETAKTDWSSFTKGYFLNRSTLVAVLLLVDASVPPQKIDLDCANWLGRNNIPITFVFTKCDKMKVAKGKRPDENIRDFQELIRQNYKQHPPWIMTSSVTGLGRDELLLHMSQLRNYWDQQEKISKLSKM